ncbi:MAG: OmpH family outer membrane protein [Verrucomicrobia bacterium]|nr:OmpH family outer membrane protein [Verrucomicrobiota bacterium]MBU1734081.1 OmpH family outer membrane protein [Verrucomicrobiota bacterium]MBU1856190.1 OmpH family outer membrane protein [Verrucomicrobiota bacterium]
MNMRSLSLLTTAGLCLALATALNAAEPAMAFVSMERLFDDYYKTKAANVQLKARFESVDVPRRELMNQVKTLKTEVEKLGAEARDKSLSDAERDKKRTAAEDKFALFRDAETKLAEFDNTYKKQFGEQMKQSQQQLVGEIRAVIGAYVKEHGIRIVFDSSGKTLNSVESVVYYDPAFDITEPILAILNKNAAEPEANKTTGTNSIKKTP